MEQQSCTFLWVAVAVLVVWLLWSMCQKSDDKTEKFTTTHTRTPEGRVLVMSDYTGTDPASYLYRHPELIQDYGCGCPTTYQELLRK